MPFPATAESDDSRSLAPFESTPLARVEEAARLANIVSSDVVVDLGCGDGRVAMAAARRGARASRRAPHAPLETCRSWYSLASAAQPSSHASQ